MASRRQRWTWWISGPRWNWFWSDGCAGQVATLARSASRFAEDSRHPNVRSRKQCEC